MEVDITARQMEITPALRDYVHSRIAKAEKYVNRSYGARVVLEVNKLRHIAEIILHVKGEQLTAKEEGAEMYASIDGAMDKIEQQLRRYKGKNVHHKGGTSLADEAATIVGDELTD
ncbi:MAG: ribosome-associated translation inhibitor RaiA [Nitrospirota bacterium]|nr:ribosome-associated translation inhibitor RaiA [Nitrospirota bacterium]